MFFRASFGVGITPTARKGPVWSVDGLGHRAGGGMTPEWRPVAGGQAAESLAAGVGGGRWAVGGGAVVASLQETKKSLTYPRIHKAFVFLALSFSAPWGGRRDSNL